MYILGINAYHADSSAALIKDGHLVAALEEERVRRVKHWAGLPTEAARFCLEEEDITLDDIDYIAIGRDPRAHFWSKVMFTLKTMPNPKLILDRIKNMGKVTGVVKGLAEEFEVEDQELLGKLEYVEHHKAHLGNAFFISPFDEAAVVSTDAMGDFVSTMWGKGEDNNIDIDDWVEFPHSLGYFYTAITQHLGFQYYGDEYKVMGLSAYGSPEEYMDEMKEIVNLKEGGRFELNLDYFQIHKGEATTSWENQAPQDDILYSDKLEDLLGPPRGPEEDIEEKHKNIASAAQNMYEEALFHVLENAYEKTGSENLCLAGGTAQNSAANGKILENTSFKEVYIPSSAHDGGNALGAAFYLYNQKLKKPRGFELKHPFWGAGFSDKEIEDSIRENLNEEDFEIQEFEEKELFEKVAKILSEGKVVGWFQGRSEWGPRALGNRSILADPRREDMRDIINNKIKYREEFRPFAPTILEGAVGDYFEQTYPSPFMEKVYNVKEEKRDEIPAVVHKDGTGRLQSLSQDFNYKYWKLIKEFENITDVPVLLNTSFNENEPIVNTPEEALDCFTRTDMDVVVLGDFLIKKE